MGNLLKDGLDYVKMTAWDQPTGILKDVGKGDIGGAFGKWKHTFGDNNDHEEKLFGDVGIRGWVGKHPTESAGAVVGSIFGGIYAAGAYGATAAAGSGAAAGGSGAAAGVAGTGSSALGGAGVGAYMAPAASGGVTATGTGAGLTSTGALSAASANAPSTMALINMGNAGVGASSATAGASSFTPAMLTTQGAAASGGTYGAASAPASASALGTVPASTGGASSSSALSNPDTWSQISRLMNSVKSNDQGQQQQLSSAPMAPAARGGFNFDRKAFQNQALTKTYSDLYNSPARAANIKF